MGEPYVWIYPTLRSYKKNKTKEVPSKQGDALAVVRSPNMANTSIDKIH
jgi:hypothetical protein